MTLKEFYEQIDSDYKDVIKRLCDENMIKKFVFKFPEDPSFNDLTDGLNENDAEKAFCAVHTLKGVCSNLGFERLYEASYELTEKLRNREVRTYSWTPKGVKINVYQRTERASTKGI